MSLVRNNSWHVRTSIGSELGPIDSDTLLTMSAGGLLCDADLVRSTNESEWRPLPDVLEWLRTNAAALPSPAATPSSESSASSSNESPPTSSASSRERNHEPETKQSVRPRALPGWKEPQPPKSRTVARSPDSTSARKPEPAASPPTADTTSLDQWKEQRQKSLNRLLDKVAAREAAAIIESDTNHNAATSVNLDEAEAGPSSPAETSDVEEKPAAAATSPAKSESFEEMKERWRRSLPSWQVVVVVLAVTILAIVYWPTFIRKGRLAARYYDIYCELERRRFRTQDRTGMEEFSRATTAELQTHIPQLEKMVADRDLDSKELLWMARDCLLPILKNPRSRDLKAERDLKKLFANWDKRHNTKYSEMPDPGGDSE